MPMVSGTSSRPVCAGEIAAHHLQIDRQEGDQRDQRGAVAGGERVAAPDRRLAQQGDRDERRGRAHLLAHQQHAAATMPTASRPPASGSADSSMCCACSSASSVAVDEQREQQQPERVGPSSSARPATRFSQPAGERRRAMQPDRHVDQEDRLPAEMLGEIAAGDRAEGVGAHRDRGEIALVARALARRDRLADQRLRQRHQPAAAEALQHAGERQQLDRRAMPRTAARRR